MSAGAGRLLGVDNGQPDSHESYQGPNRKAFNGLALVVLQPAGALGTVTLSASSPVHVDYRGRLGWFGRIISLAESSEPARRNPGQPFADHSGKFRFLRILQCVDKFVVFAAHRPG
jgi:hypothetical protein